MNKAQKNFTNRVIIREKYKIVYKKRLIIDKTMKKNFPEKFS